MYWPVLPRQSPLTPRREIVVALLPTPIRQGKRQYIKDLCGAKREGIHGKLERLLGPFQGATLSCLVWWTPG